MIKRVTHAHLDLIWYHSEPSEVPYSLNKNPVEHFLYERYLEAALGSIVYCFILEVCTRFIRLVWSNWAYSVFMLCLG